MSKEQTLSQPSSRVSFKELQQIIKMGLNSCICRCLVSCCDEQSFLPIVNTQILLMLIGSTLIMGGACALNNYYDQDIDRIMPSKQNRPTVNDRISDKIY